MDRLKFPQILNKNKGYEIQKISDPKGSSHTYKSESGRPKGFSILSQLPVSGYSQSNKNDRILNYVSPNLLNLLKIQNIIYTLLVTDYHYLPVRLSLIACLYLTVKV